jgi:hypothetical protein
MSQLAANEIQGEGAKGREAAASIIFARAMRLYREGELERAIALFEEVIALAGEKDAQRDIACVAAHISLYKIHRSLNHEREAGEHFNKAVSLGASARRLTES